MSTLSTPPWNAPANGILNDAWTVTSPDGVNQFLGTHATYAIYPGGPILTPAGSGVSPWAQQLSTQDVDQPFTMSGTSIGYVTVPLLAVGDGGDLLVSICADNAGTPGAMLSQLRVPAAWITQLSAVTGASVPATDAAVTQTTGNPLAVSQFNSVAIGAYTTTPYSPPATGNANIINPAIVSSGNYLINLGGANQVTGANVANVFVASASGTILGPLIPQASLPQTNWTGAATATTDTLILAGGFINATDTNPTTNVFAASWDPASGTIGAWSAQAALPTGSQYAGIASSGETVYVIGGQNASGYLAKVYYATVSNGQITTWATGPTLPQQLASTAAVALNGFLIVTGGENSLGSSSSTYYAAINSDGSLGPWLQGPVCPGAAINGGNQIAAAGNAIVTYGGGVGATLGVSPSGLATSWSQITDASLTSQPEWLLIPGDGVDYQLFTADPIAGRYRTAAVTPTPQIQVPIHTPGLTDAATYHLLLQQVGGDANNYLRTHLDLNAFPGDPTALTSTRGAYSWSALTPSGTCVPINVKANVQPPLPILPVHMIDDSNARIATLVSATTPDRRLVGMCEATQKRKALNSNSGFEFALTPWAVTGGVFQQSSVQAYRSGFSCQVTPSGSASVVYIQSEMLPCLPGQQFQVYGWAWFTSAVTSNASVSVNWYDQHGTYISTSSNNASVAATTWTQLSGLYTAPASGTLPYLFTINAALSGTPPAANVHYWDDVYAYAITGGEQNATVTEISWSGTWPGQVFPPTGTTQLA